MWNGYSGLVNGAGGIDGCDGALAQQSLHVARTISKSLKMPGQKTTCWALFDIDTTP